MTTPRPYPITTSDSLCLFKPVPSQVKWDLILSPSAFQSHHAEVLTSFQPPLPLRDMEIIQASCSGACWGCLPSPKEVGCIQERKTRSTWAPRSRLILMLWNYHLLPLPGKTGYCWYICTSILFLCIYYHMYEFILPKCNQTINSILQLVFST